jgi:hypothetical protein
MKVTKNLNDNLKTIQSTLNTDDLIIYNFKIDSVDAIAVYMENLCDKEIFGKQAVKPLSEISGFEKIDDLKQPYMPQLINSTYDYLYMNSEGKMVHSGNWRYRLGLWFQKKVDK